MIITPFVSQLLQWLPLFVFMLYPRFREMSADVWQEAFYVASACALLVIMFLSYKKIILDRLRLGISVFLMIGAAAFLIDAEPVLIFYDTYKGAVFFVAMLLVGVATTLFSDFGFVGIAGDKDTIRKSSLYLLGATVCALIWSVVTNSQDMFVSIAIPFIVLRLYRLSLIKKLTPTQD